MQLTQHECRRRLLQTTSVTLVCVALFLLGISKTMRPLHCSNIDFSYLLVGGGITLVARRFGQVEARVVIVPRLAKSARAERADETPFRQSRRRLKSRRRRSAMREQ